MFKAVCASNMMYAVQWLPLGSLCARFVVHDAFLSDELLDSVGSDDGSHYVAFVLAGVFFLYSLFPSAQKQQQSESGLIIIITFTNTFLRT